MCGGWISNYSRISTREVVRRCPASGKVALRPRRRPRPALPRGYAGFSVSVLSDSDSMFSVFRVRRTHAYTPRVQYALFRFVLYIYYKAACHCGGVRSHTRRPDPTRPRASSLFTIVPTNRDRAPCVHGVDGTSRRRIGVARASRAPRAVRGRSASAPAPRKAAAQARGWRCAAVATRDAHPRWRCGDAGLTVRHGLKRGRGTGCGAGAPPRGRGSTCATRSIRGCPPRG